MRREHKAISIAPQIPYLLNIEDSLIDKSTYARAITNHSATVTDGYIELTNSKYFDIPYSNDICKWNVDGYTIELDCYQINRMVCKPNIRHGSLTCQGNNQGSIDYWSFGIESQNVVFYYYSGASRSISGTTTIPLNEWHTIKMRYYQGNVYLYLDGNFEISSAVIGTPQFSSAYKLVFNGYGANNPGVRVKNIRIYMS